MDTNAPQNSSDSSSRGRGGRSHSRGGLGKYLRARGRGHRGGGRPAEFRERLVLNDEQTAELDEEEEARTQRYARRQLGTNADRYKEPEPELDSDGEEIVEPEVDLSKFLERQRLEDAQEPVFDLKRDDHEADDDDDDDVDHSFDHIAPKPKSGPDSRKGKVQQIEWDDSLVAMRREKAVAEAHRDLKDRFRSRVAQQKSRPFARGSTTSRSTGRQSERAYVEAPPLPTEQQSPPKDEKAQMQDFLDDLLS